MEVRFGSVRFGSVRFGSVQFGSIDSGVANSKVTYVDKGNTRAGQSACEPRAASVLKRMSVRSSDGAHRTSYFTTVVELEQQLSESGT